MSLEDNKALVQRAADLFDGYETDAFDEVYSPELAEAFRNVILTMPFGKHHLRLTDMVAEGNKVAVKMATSGGHTAEWEGIPPTGKDWTNRGMGFAVIENGKIIEFDLLFDELAHLKQLGATINPPTPS